MYKRPPKIVNIVIISLCFIAFLISLHIFLGRAVLKYTNKVKAEFKSKQNKLQESEKLIRNFPNPQKAMEDMEKKMDELKDKRVSPTQVPRLIQLLAEPASTSKLNVISIKPRDDIKPDAEELPVGVNKVYIEVVVGGSYQLIGEYIKTLSELPAGFVIEDLSMEKEQRYVRPLVADKDSRELEEKPPELLATLLVSIYTMWEL